MVYQNERQELLFVEKTRHDTVYYTLTNRNGDVLRSKEIPLNLEIFIETIRKAGFREVDYC